MMTQHDSGENPPSGAYPHQPVLYQEVLNGIRPASPGRYIDGTLGAGGHAWGILDASRPDGRLLGLDLDPQALEIASRRLSVFGERAALVQASYTTMAEQAHRLGWEAVQGITLDLGVSSMQFDRPERGFSFMKEGPLDMRFTPDNPVSAATLVNELDEVELADLIWRYGDENQSRKIARAIVRGRPYETTTQLADAILRGMGGPRGKIHPATRTFQALRIAVNKELQSLEATLPMAASLLAPGGRLAVISFHSLEDRMVKQFFQRESRDCICPPEQLICTCGHTATLKLVTRHPLEAGDEEVKQNPRARSAKLRVAEKI